LADDSRPPGGDVQSTAEPPFARALVVDDDERLRRTVVECLAPWAAEVRDAGCLADAIDLAVQWHPDLLVLDFKLPDGDARDLLRRLAQHPPVPSAIAMSAYAEPEESFDLGHLGVRRYLKKPFDQASLEAALRQALTPPDLTPHLRGAVGRVTLDEVEENVRRTMMAEALSRTQGSRRAAARLLGVSRQFVQHVMRKLGR
jgi:DNA-binding NtrC family response regulator